MRRRDFLTASIAFAWVNPARSRAQTAPRRLAFLFTLPETDPQTPRYLAALRSGLQAEGWSIGPRLALDARFGSMSTEIAGRMAEQLLDLRPDVILPVGTTNAVAVAQRTSTIPIVFGLVVDPVAAGLIDNTTEPKSNVTGFLNYDPAIVSKWLQFLKEVKPGLVRVGYLYSPESPLTGLLVPTIEDAAAGAGLEAVGIAVSSATDIASGLADLASVAGSGLIVSNDAFLLTNRAAIVAEVDRHALATIWGHVVYATDGAMLCYAIDAYAQIAAAAGYAGRILNGARVAQLPIQLPEQFHLSVNLKTAAAMGITVPEGILTLADEVVE